MPSGNRRWAPTSENIWDPRASRGHIPGRPVLWKRVEVDVLSVRKTRHDCPINAIDHIPELFLRHYCHHVGHITDASPVVPVPLSNRSDRPRGGWTSRRRRCFGQRPDIASPRLRRPDHRAGRSMPRPLLPVKSQHRADKDSHCKPLGRQCGRLSKRSGRALWPAKFALSELFCRLPISCPSSIYCIGCFASL